MKHLNLKIYSITILAILIIVNSSSLFSQNDTSIYLNEGSVLYGKVNKSGKKEGQWTLINRDSVIIESTFYFCDSLYELNSTNKCNFFRGDKD